MGELEPHDHRNGAAGLTPGDIPGLARVVAVSSFRVGVWAAATGVRAGQRIIDVGLHPSHGAEFAEDLQAAAQAVTRALLGTEVEARMRQVATGNAVVRVVADAVDSVSSSAMNTQAPDPVNPLHEAGQELMRRSRDVWNDDDGHPAYARMISELAPDEGRILMLLLRKGPQATVDVRSGGLIGTMSSSLVKANLNMIGALAGCRHVERVPSYLHNLERLGLIWFSRETLRDPLEYQVLEAQPDVTDALRSQRRTKVVRRSINLTPFGEDFCRDGLGLHLSMAELQDVPQHAKPPSEA